MQAHIVQPSAMAALTKRSQQYEVAVDQMGREHKPVTGATNLRKCLPALFGIWRIPPAGPHAPDKATRAHACP